MNQSNSPASPRWMSVVLKLAAVYNLVWGAWVILFPNQLFALTGMDLPNHPAIWQGMGMVIGVYGLGYWWASYDPVRHWPIVAVGLMGKVFGPLGFVIHYFQGTIPAVFGLTLFTNDLVWWVPFGLILKRAHDQGWPLRADSRKEC